MHEKTRAPGEQVFEREAPDSAFAAPYKYILLLPLLDSK